MRMRSGGWPAFPSETEDGMSLRDWLAGQAIVALGTHKAVDRNGLSWLAEHAYMLADEMLQVRDGEVR